MSDPTTLYPEQQEMLVALKQLFTAVELEVNKATITPQIFHDILIHLEQTHEHFHRFEFVKILQRKVDEALSGIIDTELSKRPNSDPLDVIPEVTDVVFRSPEFNELQETFCLAMQEIIDVMVEIYHDPVRWEIGTPYIKHKNYHSNDDLSSSSNQTGCMFFTSDQYLQIARNLDQGMPLHSRQNALSCLFKTAPGECEHWPAIRQGIMEALADGDYNFAEEALTLHAKLFNSGTSYSTGELYTSLSGHLIQHFQISGTYHLKLNKGLDTANKNTRCLLKRFMLLSIFQHDIPTFWIRCPERHMIHPITQTIQLLSLPPPEEGNILPIHYLALFDHEALWFKKWMHGCFTRSLVITAIGKHSAVLTNAIESISNIVLPEIGSKDVYSSFTYSFKQIKYLEFVHSANLICSLVQYKAGRELVQKINGKDGVVTLLNTLINNMCISNPVFSHLDSSLDPQTIVAELLREIIVSGEACRKLLSSTVTLGSLLKPLLDLPNSSIKYIQAVCDILSIICSYSEGCNQLINTKVSYQGSEMSAASLIGQLCKELILPSSKDMSTHNKSVLSALLFLARQIYTTYDGLAVMISFNLVHHVNELLTVSGDITPQPPPVTNDDSDEHDSENCFEDVLIDNMLGFAGTPKGLLLLYKDNMLDQCIDYLYQRKCKKLQVSKTQKFGYGYMVSQIASIPSGLVALQRTGFLRQLSNNLWWLLENSGPSTPVEVPVTQPPDPYFEGIVLKAMTSLLQVLLTYDSLYCILWEQTILVPLNPDLFRQPEPQTLLDIIDRIIYIDTATKRQCLMNYDIMQIFGLRILSVLLSCLDTLLFCNDTYDIINFLLKCQQDSKVEDKIVIDEATIERNRILVRSCVLGGGGEKVIPHRITNETMSDDYKFELFDELPLPPCYITAPIQSEPRDDIKLSMSLVDNNSDSSWLDKTRQFVLAVCRKSHFSGHVGLIEVVLKYQLQENTCPFKMILEDNVDNSHQPSIIGIEYGCDLIVQYGIRLGLLASDTPTQPLKQLCLSVAAALSAQQHTHLKKERVKFDWFVGVMYLLLGGDTQRTAHFLSTFSSTLTSAYLWSLRLLSSQHISENIASSGVTVVHYKACYCIERVLQKALPMVSSAFRMSGLSPTHIAKRWITTCFLNVLPWGEICNYILIVISEGPVYSILFCVALLKHIRVKLLQHSTNHRLLYYILEEPIEDFMLSNYLDYMLQLEKEHGVMLRADLENFQNVC